jgi:SulP family sulfate permease
MNICVFSRSDGAGSATNPEQARAHPLGDGLDGTAFAGHVASLEYGDDSGAVLLLGILQGILLAALASVLMLLVSVSRPYVAFLARIPGTNDYSDMARHAENEPLLGVIAVRPEASLLYINADAVLETILNRLAANPSDIRMVICDLSASPHIDLAGSRMLHELHGKLAALGIPLRIIAHGRVRDLLRADGIGEKVGGLDRVTIDSLLSTAGI